MTTNATMHAALPAPSALHDAALAEALLLDMLRVRQMEEACAQLYGVGKIRGFLHLYIGEEAVAAGAMRALAPEDNVAATYREHAHALLRGVPMRKIMAEMFGKRDGCCRGRGGSMHLFDREARFYGGNAIVGGGLPLAVGLALADRMRKQARVSACFFGEGALAEGAFHESMNLAALWRLPVLFLCENNFYAMGTALAHEHADANLCERAASYGMPATRADGMDVVAVHQAVLDAVGGVRNGGGPAFVECQTYRYRAHSMFDPELYRDKAEVQAWKERGPLHNLSARMKAAGMLTEERFLALQDRVATEVSDAAAYAEASLPEPVEGLLDDVHTAPGGEHEDFLP
jgi:pyruvate dehydrogenase E1 component alpha subunit